MSINIGPPAVEELRPRITVIGVGGAGGVLAAELLARRGPAVAEVRDHVLLRLAGALGHHHL